MPFGSCHPLSKYHSLTSQPVNFSLVNQARSDRIQRKGRLQSRGPISRIYVLVGNVVLLHLLNQKSYHKRGLKLLIYIWHSEFQKNKNRFAFPLTIFFHHYHHHRHHHHHHQVQYLVYLKVKEKLAQSGATSWYFGRIREFQRILWAQLGSLKF